MVGEKEVSEKFMQWFGECKTPSDVEMLRAILSDMTEREYENRLYDLKD